jgi:hypothetical protein
MSNIKGNRKSMERRLKEYVEPLLIKLDDCLDKRLVRTFLKTLEAIITFRHTVYGLLLSELGGYILSPEHAPAGTKRLSNLLRSSKWTGKLIEDFLWHKALQQVDEAEGQGEDVYIGWDESEVEKAESIALEGLCPVRSTTAARLKRIKPGFFNPPGGRPVFVPGMQWITLLVLASSLAPVVAAMQWWTTRGQHASCRRDEELALLKRCWQAWGRRVIHLWDRGFASQRWLQWVLQYTLRFILRWPKRLRLLNAKGELLNAWKITRGKRSMAHRNLWDYRRRCWRKTGIIFAPVRLPECDTQLWLVVARPGPGREPWYLLTNEPILSVDDAWRIVAAYTRRWQVETALPLPCSPQSLVGYLSAIPFLPNSGMTHVQVLPDSYREDQSDQDAVREHYYRSDTQPTNGAELIGIGPHRSIDEDQQHHASQCDAVKHAGRQLHPVLRLGEKRSARHER